jgi:hypothetical protein
MTLPPAALELLKAVLLYLALAMGVAEMCIRARRVRR